MRGGGDDLRAFVLGCPQLTSLYIDDTGDVEQDPASVARMPLPYDPPPFCNLDTLVWHVPSLPLLMQSRQAVDAPTTLPLLVAHALESGCTIPLLRLAVGHNLRLSNATRSIAKQLVASAGDTLESLVLRLEDLGEGCPPEYIRNALLPELSENHRLKSLHILAVGSAWFEIHNGLSAITYVLSTIPAEQDALEDVVIHLTPYVPRSQQDWSVATWVQLVDEIAALMHAHPRMKCTLCLDFSSNYGERPRPVDQRGIAEYVGKLVDALPHRRSEEESVKLPPRISLIWQTHFRDWECEGDTYPERNYVGEAMGAPEWYYRLRYGAP
ncbi:hypothetical protein EVJ58_g2105 [Rhodofomes roseus]|uniref:Uncharacterized protein n=1 Tax=Rhodofomes roseus TaxID=34475 RepID=A0A4Y9YTY7_9APHY|nr:hypothetical protein EVJ58_g2105 [Rhodofomes roseus]